MSDPIEFHGVASLDLEVAEKLKAYLQEKESELLLLRVADTEQWEHEASRINNLLWEYVELLDGFSVELYRHVKQINFDQWTEGLCKIVNDISTVLMEKMKGALFTIDKLENSLWKIRLKNEKKKGKIQTFFKRLYYPFVSILDRSLNSYLKKSVYQLKSQKNSFHTRYENFQVLQQKVEHSLKKFEHFKIFSSLDSKTKQDYKELHRLLKMWQLDEKTHAIPPKDIARLLRSRISIEQMTTHFKTYFDQATEQLFALSRTIKSDQLKIPTKDQFNAFRREVRSLKATIATYRNFFLRTHPNPYVRTRFGFSEWVVGPEPTQTRKLLNLVFEVEQLDELYEDLQASTQNRVETPLQNPADEIDATLHEMGQPLTPRHLLRSRAEKLLEQLEGLDELGSKDPKVVQVVGSALSKAISIDWRHQVLFEFPLFHQLYKLHCGIDSIPKDEEHQRRKECFTNAISKCQKWVTSRKAYRHANELNLLIQDVENKLSAFLNDVKEEKKGSQIIQRELLEYRYQFSEFFHFLNDFDSEGKWIRNQFLFVNQYLETIDNIETYE
ncbi:MAG: hypothetical protein WD595_05190 [Waddliaceae bacterium]